MSNLREFVCYICDNGLLLDKYQLEEHLRKIHPTAEKKFQLVVNANFYYACDDCDAHFRTETELHQHIVKHRLLYYCALCTQDFSNMVEFAMHYNVQHIESNMYECPFCEVQLKRRYKTRFVHHCFKFHTKAPFYKCGTCNGRFVVLTELTEHTCSGKAETFSCTDCSDKFANSIELSKHRKKHHMQECKICKVKCKGYKSMRMHINRVHKGFGNEICDVCGKTIKYGYLKKHMNMHLGIKDHQCSYCGKWFANTDRLNEHERVHTGERPFKCQYCEKRFTQRSSRKLHERLHTNERPFLCHICNKGNISKTALNTHLKVCPGVL